MSKSSKLPKVLTREEQTVATILSGSSTIKEVMFNDDFTRVGFLINGIEGATFASSSVWIDFEYFAPRLKHACRTKKGKQFDLMDEHLLHLVDQPVAWNKAKSALLKKGQKFESGAVVTTDEYLVIKSLHLTNPTLQLRKLFSKNAGGKMVMDFKTESKNVKKEANDFLNQATTATETADKRKAATAARRKAKAAAAKAKAKAEAVKK